MKINNAPLEHVAAMQHPLANVCSIGPISLRRFAADSSRRAAQPLVPVVEVEEYFAHIAAMAGVASSNILVRDAARNLGAQVGDQFLDESAARRQLNQRRQPRRNVRGHK